MPQFKYKYLLRRPTFFSETVSEEVIKEFPTTSSAPGCVVQVTRSISTSICSQSRPQLHRLIRFYVRAEEFYASYARPGTAIKIAKRLARGEKIRVR